MALVTVWQNTQQDIQVSNGRSDPSYETRSKAYRVMELRSAVEIGEILALVQPGLQRVEKKMKTVEASLFTPLANAFVDMIGSGGKRLRPAVALMAAQLNGGVSGGMNGGIPEAVDERVISLAASVEMLHTATLVHDDVIDGALLRRGSPTLNAMWSRGATVLAGDNIFARAAYFAAQTNNPRVIQIFSDTLQIIVNGELRQLWSRCNFHQTQEEYYRRIDAKTASLFSAAAESAGVLAVLDEENVQRLRSYGHNLGMAFQIVDDILDFTGDQGSLGKPAGSDLLQGTLTLPFFHYLQTLPEPERLLEQLETGYEDATGDYDAWRDRVAQIAADMKTSTAIEAARQEAIAFLDRAKDSLSAFPQSPYRAGLLDLCDFVVQRTY